MLNRWAMVLGSFILLPCLGGCQPESTESVSNLEIFEYYFEDNSYKGACYQEGDGHFRDYVDIYRVGKRLHEVKVPFKDNECKEASDTAAQDSVIEKFTFNIAGETSQGSNIFKVDQLREDGSTKYGAYKIEQRTYLFRGKFDETLNGTSAEFRPLEVDSSYQFFMFTKTRGIHETDCEAQGDQYRWKNARCKSLDELESECKMAPFHTEWKDETCQF